MENNQQLEQPKLLEELTNKSPLEITSRKILWRTLWTTIIYFVTVLIDLFVQISKNPAPIFVNINQIIIDTSTALPLFVLIAGIWTELEDRKMLTAFRLQEEYKKGEARGEVRGEARGEVRGEAQVLDAFQEAQKNGIPLEKVLETYESKSGNKDDQNATSKVP